VFRYRLHSPDGDDLGEATYAQMIKVGEEIIAGKNEHFRVVDVVTFDEEAESQFVGGATGRGCVEVGAASGTSVSDSYALAASSLALFSPLIVLLENVAPGFSDANKRSTRAFAKM
jgi:hypothetical protein